MLPYPNGRGKTLKTSEVWVRIPRGVLGSLSLHKPLVCKERMPYKDREIQLMYVRKDQAQRRAKVRQIIRAAKDCPCTDCGVPYPYYVMEFDHGDNEKLYGISRIVSHPTNKAIADLPVEIAKCEVVCANCHRLRHGGVTYQGGSAIGKSVGCDPTEQSSIL